MISDLASARIYAPEPFWAVDIDDRHGGCGPGRLGDLFIPDTMYGLRITSICKIHDWMYMVGETEEDREVADRVFLNNLVRWINYKTSFLPLRWLRLIRARSYYTAVRYFGGPAYWNTKNA